MVSQISEETSVLQEEIQKQSVIRSICEREGGGTRLLSVLQLPTLASAVFMQGRSGHPYYDVPLISHFPEGTENCGRPTGPACGQGSRFHGSAAFPCSKRQNSTKDCGGCMNKNCRQRLFYDREEPVVAVSSQSSRACICSTRLAYLVISVTVLQPAILSNSSVQHAISVTR